MKTIWGSQHAFVVIEANYIAGTCKERCAMTAVNKMLIEQRRPQNFSNKPPVNAKLV